MLEKLWKKPSPKLEINFFKKTQQSILDKSVTKTEVLISVSNMFLKLFGISIITLSILGFSHVMDFSEQLIKVENKNFSGALLLGSGLYVLYYMLKGIFNSKAYNKDFINISFPIKILLLQLILLPCMPNQASIFSECLKAIIHVLNLFIK